MERRLTEFPLRVLSVAHCSTVAFDNCVSKATANGRMNVAGFVGSVYNNRQVNVSFINCVQDGTTSGSTNAGSFVGGLSSNEGMSVNMTKCVNSGKVQGDSAAAGFVGLVSLNKNTGMTIADSVNKGNVIGSSSVGGLIGGFRANIKTEITLLNCTNNGELTGTTGFSGGLVGYVGFDSETESAKLVIQNCANKGAISVSGGSACGMFCVEPSKAQCLTSHVVNSINKGKVNSGADVYGAANIVSKADNFVSIGELTASSNVFSFWNESADVGRVYCLKSGCSKCDYATQVEYQSSEKIFVVVSGSENLRDLLTFQARKMRYGMVWTDDLELVYGEMPPPAPSYASSLLPPSAGVVNALSPLVVAMMALFSFIMTHF